VISVSFIIPTLNAAKVITPCLSSILKQTIKNYEIIVADGGSTDKTITIAKKYGAKIISNPLKTAEAGKATGLKNASGEYIAFIDSDNILPSKKWLETMLLPFKNSTIICSEPIRFTYRQNGGFIERYSALLGANDPYAWFNGVYDRYSYLTNKWTNLRLDQTDKKHYVIINLQPKQQLPTIGANGTIFRSSFLKKNFTGDYFFDTDILSSIKRPVSVAKVKIGIIHTYCEASISKFIRKQHRRLTDMYSYQTLRRYNWHQKIDFISLVKNNLSFALYSILIFPALLHSFRGFIKKPDLAWFFHPFACLLSFLIYTKITLLHLLGFHLTTERLLWHQ